MFQTLHSMFELHYTELAMAVDAIAERIRALGLPAPGSYAAFGRLASVPDTMGSRRHSRWSSCWSKRMRR